MEKLITVKNLRLKFPAEDTLIFKDLTVSISRGEKVLLLGPSGCGKSTLLQVLSGIIPDSIEVPLKYDAIQKHEYWGFVFQDPDTQFCMPYVDEELAFVLENLRIPQTQMKDAMMKILQTVGLEHVPLHMKIDELSQGMKQRLALASALLLDPEVLFLDEPSALLDPEGTEQIWESVKNIADDKTVIIVEHKIGKIANWVDRVILFNHLGEIIADGIPEDIFTIHQAKLIEYGIWYPRAWEDYVTSTSYQALMNKRNNHIKNKTIIKLIDFKGYRGNKSRIQLPHAEIKQGDWLTIIGENGAGKSTLLLSLIQLLRTSGTYALNGEIISYMKKQKSVPDGLSFVFQNPELQFITNSIFEEIAFSDQLRGKSDLVIHENVQQLLALFNITDNEHKHPFQLSTGQKRRLSVATAFTHGAEILILDEPTFGQDARNTFMILEQLEQLRQHGTTIIMVTHDEAIIDTFATSIWKIADGKLVHIEQRGYQR